MSKKNIMLILLFALIVCVATVIAIMEDNNKRESSTENATLSQNSAGTENVTSSEGKTDTSRVSSKKNSSETQVNTSSDGKTDTQTATSSKNKNSSKKEKYSKSTSDGDEAKNENSPQEKIKLSDINGKGKKYTFTYKGELFTASYTKDNWHIVDSYKVDDSKDITEICQALINVHPIHGKDMKSYRTAGDMAYEWIQHNLAYKMLPDGNEWKEHAKDVDLDPADQGKSLQEMYKSRIEKMR